MNSEIPAKTNPIRTVLRRTSRCAGESDRRIRTGELRLAVSSGPPGSPAALREFLETLELTAPHGSLLGFLEPAARVKFCFKCTPEKFAELVEIEGVIPAPYMARNHWVGIVELSALRQPEMKELIRNSYQMVFEKLPKKLQAELGKKKSSPVGKVRKRIQ